MGAITYWRDTKDWKYSRTSITRTQITLIPRNFLCLDQNFTESYPDNSNSPLTRTVFRFPSEFELPGLYLYCAPTIPTPQHKNEQMVFSTPRNTYFCRGTREAPLSMPGTEIIRHKWPLFIDIYLHQVPFILYCNRCISWPSCAGGQRRESSAGRPSCARSRS